ncbi:MAG TPA: 1-deoxy-D-xylulose-5-phosphate synthase [Mycobacteriales bacterium]|nr:1-deoxy-D-xylulose-5-phosphate synthase [Mycobacteriales bacterium]
MGLLSAISSPRDLKALTLRQCTQLAAECRDFLVQAVSRTGGHLGPNLGVVELTIALHRVFDSPRDRIVWDTGHQAYVHKMLTGRQDGFTTLRQPGGLSGYPSRSESVHDVVENSHASTALSYADGLATAYALRGERDRTVVAVVGDGALTGGMCWEALNSIAAAKDRRIIIVVNDNGRSYAPTTGGLADHLATLRTIPAYERTLDAVRATLTRVPLIGRHSFAALHALKRGIKDAVQPQVMFEDLGLKYVGPIDGHDIGAVEGALRRAHRFGGPVLVHCVTRKGFGYAPAENDDADCLHGPGAFDPRTGRLLNEETETWTSVVGDELVALAADDPTLVAITASMLQPVGLGAFAAAHPDRVLDVGIAEQHATTSAAGLALGGLKPVVCLYATFLNRAFDQVLLDVALHRAPVTFLLDRAGITGPDGASHHGVWDLAWLGLVPGIRVAAPRDVSTLRTELREAVADLDGPTVVRYPKGGVGPDVPAIARAGAVDVLARTASDDEVLLVAVGAMARTAVEAAGLAAAEGVGVTVADPRWVLPVPDDLIALASGRRLVAVVEDGLRAGGIGDAVARALRDAGSSVPVRTFGLATAFIPQGRRDDLLREAGLSAGALAGALVAAVARTADKVELPVD